MFIVHGGTEKKKVLKSNPFLYHSSSETHGRIVEEISALFKEIWRKEYAHIASIDFRNAVGHYHTMFSGPDHQDSHEFLRILIDWMHLDLETLNPVCTSETRATIPIVLQLHP